VRARPGCKFISFGFAVNVNFTLNVGSNQPIPIPRGFFGEHPRLISLSAPLALTGINARWINPPFVVNGEIGASGPTILIDAECFPDAGSPLVLTGNAVNATTLVLTFEVPECPV